MDGSITEVDRTLCRVFKTERAFSEFDAFNATGKRRPLNRREYRLAPNGMWFTQVRAFPPLPFIDLPQADALAHFREIHPVLIAHQFIFNGEPIPPELEAYRVDATEPAFFAWLAQYANTLPNRCESSMSGVRSL
jgi:hypothetical protein